MSFSSQKNDHRKHTVKENETKEKHKVSHNAFPVKSDDTMWGNLLETVEFGANKRESDILTEHSNKVIHIKPKYISLVEPM